MNMELADYRKKLDEIDEEITDLFKKRLELSSEIGEYKRENGIATLDLAREEAIMAKAEESCGNYGRELFAEILKLCKKAQAGGRNL